MIKKARPDTAHEETPRVIVGIGASAGGLEAFTRLLGSLPSNAGIAYVLVQHLAPDHESLLPELLGRAAPIPVTQAVDGVRMLADHAYVIPPNANMTLTDGHLRLAKRTTRQGAHLSIDTFLMSLAAVHGQNTMAVILSGAGSDGVRGVEAIKEVGGIVFAQDSASAQYPSMPEAAIATGCVDFILPPEEIARRLAEIGRYSGEESDRVSSVGGDQIASVLRLLHRHTGVDLTRYRRATLERRIMRRMLMHRHQSHSDYITLLRREPAEIDALYQDMLIGVTHFFRDPEVFAELRAVGLPALWKSRSSDGPVRVWVAGCSGGEEAYSLAIEISESMLEAGIDAPLQVFGTDLNEQAIARARAGLYPESIAEHVSPERLKRFFVHEDGKYRINKSIRDRCIFSRQNIVRDPPFSHLDLVSCRNVLIYMEPALQAKVFPIFHYALDPHGLLLLGSAESPGGAPNLFEPVSKRYKLYRRRAGVSAALDIGLSMRGVAPSPRARPAGESITGHSSVDALAAEVDRLVLSRHGSDGVIVNDKLEVIHFRGDTVSFLQQRAGAPTMDVLKLVRRELSSRLRAALQKAMRTGIPALEASVPIVDGNNTRHVTIEAAPLRTPGARNFIVFFTEDTAPAATGRTSRGNASRTASQLQPLEAELAAARTTLAELDEQHRATIEELRSAGEEIQSSNEELQSTNEELETTKEEVQSTNEELNTLNEELRFRNHELSEMAGDLANIFASTMIPIVIVGRDLRLRRFTPSTTRVMKVISSDGGRPVGDVKLRFAMTDLEAVITNSIDTLAISDRIVQTDDGCWWSLVIRPYQTVDRRVDGVVLAFSDVSTSKRSEDKANVTSESRRVALVAAEQARVVELVRSNDMLEANLREQGRAAQDRNVLLRDLASAQEDERSRLSRELHDEAGQQLTALGLGLQALTDTAPAGTEFDERIRALRELVDTLGRELHDIALRLRPKALDDLGLESAVAGYVQDWSSRSGMDMDIHVNLKGERLSSQVETAVYRVIQEALTNVAKHSGASRASIVIERRADSLHTIIEDDGRGFNPLGLRKGNEAAGLGLLGIRERIALLGGSMDVESIIDNGTTMFVRIPITQSSVSASAENSPGSTSAVVDPLPV